MKVLRHPSLNRADDVRIRAELQNRPAARLLGELGVHDFVGPVAKRARRRNSHEDVGVAGPNAIGEGGLDDDLGAARHGVAGLRDSRVGELVLAEVDDLQALAAKGRHVRALVLVAARSQDLQEVVVRLRRLHLPARDGKLQRRQVRASEMIREVGRGEPKLAVGEAHRVRRRGSYPATAPAYPQNASVDNGPSGST